jgi:hypothetical protein
MFNVTVTHYHSLENEGYKHVHRRQLAPAALKQTQLTAARNVRRYFLRIAAIQQLSNQTTHSPHISLAIIQAA